MALRAAQFLFPTLRHTLRISTYERGCKVPDHRVGYLAHIKHASGVAISRERMESEAPAVLIRDATRDDMPILHRMIHELAKSEGFPEAPQLTVEDLIKDGLECTPPWFSTLVAECGGEIVGYALFHCAYSTWTGRFVLVEDLYVVSKRRSQGVAQAIIIQLCKRARLWGATCLKWYVLLKNKRALRFYEHLGAQNLYQTERRVFLKLPADRIRACSEGKFLFEKGPYGPKTDIPQGLDDYDTEQADG